jgi:hypothetical protein
MNSGREEAYQYTDINYTGYEGRDNWGTLLKSCEQMKNVFFFNGYK